MDLIAGIFGINVNKCIYIVLTFFTFIIYSFQKLRGALFFSFILYLLACPIWHYLLNN